MFDLGQICGSARTPASSAVLAACVTRSHGAHWSAEMPDTLPHAQRRLLEVLRVLAMDAKFLLLDEPAADCVEERHDLAELLRMARDKMAAHIVLIERSRTGLARSPTASPCSIAAT